MLTRYMGGASQRECVLVTPLCQSDHSVTLQDPSVEGVKGFKVEYEKLFDDTAFLFDPAGIR